MVQKVIAARDVTLIIQFDSMENVPLIIETASDWSANITGNTEDIGAISTDEPIATDNSGNTYDISFSLQEAEAIDIKDALAVSTAPDSIAHIRQIIEGATISVVWNKLRTGAGNRATKETYNFCTGVEESDSVSRRSAETIKQWRFRAKGMSRSTYPI